MFIRVLLSFFSLISSYEAKYQCLFPYNWHVDAFLLQTFCERTKEHVQTVLSRFETPEQVDVPLLVGALCCTMQFERVRINEKVIMIIGISIEDGFG